MWKKITAALFALMCLTAVASAQSTPGFYRGFVPTAAQWNAIFAGKQDVLGYVPLSTLGGTMQGRLATFASAAGAAGFNVPHGTAPSSPVNGDVWTTTAGMFAQINGSTIGPFGTGLGGTVTVPQGGTGQTTFTANRPLIGAGASAIAQGTVTSTNASTLFATFEGAVTTGNCVSINANGNLQAAGGACTTGGAGGTVSAGTIGQMAIYVTNTTTVGGMSTCNNGYVGTDGAGVNLCRTSVNTTLSATITALGTIATGTWQGTTIAAQYGGTGVNNGASTITIGGSLTLSGAFPFTATLTASTSPTFPAGTYTVANQTGTSGGIPYYSSATTMASSGVLGVNLPLFGGGAGSAPIAGTRSGNTTEIATVSGALTSGNCVKSDASGNIVDAGACAGGTTPVLLNTLTASTSTTLSDTTSFTSTYKTYTLVFINLLPSTNGDICQIQVNSGGFQTSGYIGQGVIAGSLSPVTPTTYIPCSTNVSSSGVQNNESGVSGLITVYNPSASAKINMGGTMFWNAGGGSGTATAASVQGKWNTSGAVTGIQIFYNSAAGSARASGITSGTVEVWGNP